MMFDRAEILMRLKVKTERLFDYTRFKAKVRRISYYLIDAHLKAFCPRLSGSPAAMGGFRGTRKRITLQEVGGGLLDLDPKRVLPKSMLVHLDNESIQWASSTA